MTQIAVLMMLVNGCLHLPLRIPYLCYSYDAQFRVRTHNNTDEQSPRSLTVVIEGQMTGI